MRSDLLSANFTRKENRCRCGDCEQYGADVELVDVLEGLRAHARRKWHADAVIIVHSWWRCRAHNNRSKADGGAGSNDASWHLSGAAADIHIPGVGHATVAEYLSEMYPNKYGIGLYEWGVHIDVRPIKARWHEVAGPTS